MFRRVVSLILALALCAALLPLSVFASEAEEMPAEETVETAPETEGETVSETEAMRETTEPTEGDFDPVIQEDFVSENYVDSYGAADIPLEGTCGENLTWELRDDGNLWILGTGEMVSYSSASSTPWYSYRSAIARISLPDG